MKFYSLCLWLPFISTIAFGSSNFNRPPGPELSYLALYKAMHFIGPPTVESNLVNKVALDLFLNFLTITKAIGHKPWVRKEIFRMLGAPILEKPGRLAISLFGNIDKNDHEIQLKLKQILISPDSELALRKAIFLVLNDLPKPLSHLLNVVTKVSPDKREYYTAWREVCRDYTIHDHGVKQVAMQRMCDKSIEMLMELPASIDLFESLKKVFINPQPFHVMQWDAACRALEKKYPNDPVLSASSWYQILKKPGLPPYARDRSFQKIFYLRNTPEGRQVLAKVLKDKSEELLIRKVFAALLLGIPRTIMWLDRERIIFFDNSEDETEKVNLYYTRMAIDQEVFFNSLAQSLVEEQKH